MAGYGTTAGFKTWATAKGFDYTTPAYTDPQIDAARERASDYIDGPTAASSPATRRTDGIRSASGPGPAPPIAKALSIPSDEIPVEIDNATYEGTKRELASPGALNPDLKPGGGVLKRVKAGSVEVEYDNDGTVSKTFAAIEQALGSLLVVRSRYSGVAVRA
jgi:hypothetical protein